MKNRTYWRAPLAMLMNLMLAYLAYEVCRITFVAENWSTFRDTLTWPIVKGMVQGGWMFDTSAILYTNVLYCLLMLIPLHWKEHRVWRGVAKGVFVVVNGLCIAMNLMDAVYFQYTGRRTTVTIFSEFENENNLGSIFGVELMRHWYIVLVGVLLIYGLYRLYFDLDKKPDEEERPRIEEERPRMNYWVYYISHAACMLLFIPLCIIGMRGGATTAVRPITISNANQYVDHPYEAAAVLNTPFSLIRTFDKETFVDPQYFTEEELNALYSPLHQPKAGKEFKKKNIVVLIVESFGREYIGKYNERLEEGKYQGYTPFVDSLYEESMSFDYTFCNGRKSIDGMPSVLSSIPMFIEPFFLTPASMNDVSGLAGELDKKGYYTAFFHGAENGSMGFQAFARTTGFKDYFGRTEFNEDKRFEGDKDYDGTWAIWDEPFLQFYATKMSEMQEPFMTAVFTASSHHPYVIPEAYKERFPEEGENVIHKCIRYTDLALRRFFETACKQPWYENTIFVFTSDHTNISDHAEYQTDLGGFGSPILFYDPSGELFPAGRQHKVAQQIDIMPTILSAIGYDKPYVAFGKDLLTTPDSATWAVNYNNGIYQYVQRPYLLQFDGNSTTGFYDIDTDWLLTSNMAKENIPQKAEMEQRVKAIIQSYMQRMNANKLKNDN